MHLQEHSFAQEAEYGGGEKTGKGDATPGTEAPADGTTDQPLIS